MFCWVWHVALLCPRPHLFLSCTSGRPLMSSVVFGSLFLLLVNALWVPLAGSWSSLSDSWEGITRLEERVEELLLMDGVGCSDSWDLTVHCHDSTFCSFLDFPFQHKKTLVWEWRVPVVMVSEWAKLAHVAGHIVMQRSATRITFTSLQAAVWCHAPPLLCCDGPITSTNGN